MKNRQTKEGFAQTNKSKGVQASHPMFGIGKTAIEAGTIGLRKWTTQTEAAT